MKTFAIIVVALLVAPLTKAARPLNIPHLDLEMTGREYLQLLEKQGVQKNQKQVMSDEDAQLEKYLQLGKRNLEWVDFVNANRDPSQRISLSSPATQPGNAVSSPRTYNFRIIKDRWDIIIALLPLPLKKVLIDGAPYTANIGVTDREFIEWLFQVDGAYQIAARYKMMQPYKNEMMTLAAYDVHGYLDLKEETDLDQKLTDWDAQPELTKNRFSKDLQTICLNSETERSVCSSELSAAISSKKIVEFKNKFYPFGEANYNSFFEIRGSRPDGVWTSADENNMIIPMANPHNEAVFQFLKVNIEDEWRWNGWQLTLDFQESTDPTMTHVVFEAGATPHVESAPGSTITMDQNGLLSEYDVQWTIRHEYGHVLGLPDCYHEFYDVEQEAYVSYQLDVTNLMCSRRGKFKQTHYDELKKAYYQP